MGINLAEVKIELDDDPETRGYSGMSHEAVIVDMYTEYQEENVVSVSGQAVFEATVKADFDTLSADQKAMYFAIIGMGTILVNGTNTKAALLDMFDVDTDTRANLIALQKRAISRVVKLKFHGLKAGHIQQARDL